MPHSADRALAEGFARAIPHSAAIGQEVLSVCDGEARMRQPYRVELLGDAERGLIHTAVQITLVDSAFGVAVFSALGAQESIATLDLRVDYHRPAVAGADLYALAQVERVTRQVVFVSGRVWQGEDPDKATAVARASFMRAANAQRPVAREAGE